MNGQLAIETVRTAKAEVDAVLFGARAARLDDATFAVYADVQHAGADVFCADGELLVSTGDAWREVWYVNQDPTWTQRVI